MADMSLDTAIDLWCCVVALMGTWFMWIIFKTRGF